LRKVASELVKLEASVRTDRYGQGRHGLALADLTYLSYRLGTVTETDRIVKKRPDLIWQETSATDKILLWKQKSLLLRGDWAQGELNRIIVALFAREFEKKNMHLFHASAIRYHGKSLMFMSGEQNHGKTMALIEACNRGAEILATECLIVNERGMLLDGSKEVFLISRTKGTERIDKPEPVGGAAKFFTALPEFKVAKERPDQIDAVFLPSIDGNYDFSSSKMIAFESAYQTFCSLSDFYQSNTLVTSKIAMPLVDGAELRRRRALFANHFAGDKPYYFIKASNPQTVLDEVDRLIVSSAIEH
jgi:hypothetical protein